MSPRLDNSIPNIADLHSYGDLEQTQLLDFLFEHSPAIHATLLPVIRTASYSSYPDLIDACQIRLLSLAAASSRLHPDPALLSVLGSHPRLGEKKIESAQSAAEQAKLQGDGAADQDQSEDELARLNREYEATFPGLRYVVFVGGRGRPEILRDMEERIARRDLAKEVATALQAMCDIAKDRASKTRNKNVYYEAKHPSDLNYQSENFTRG